MSKKILIIDDEMSCVYFHIHYLRANGYDVVHVDGPDAAGAFMENPNSRAPDMIILDIMMDPGIRYRGRQGVDRGMRTGVLLYPELRQKFPGSIIMILTSMRNPSILNEISKEVRILDKMEVSPIILLKIIEQEFQNHSREGAK